MYLLIIGVVSSAIGLVGVAMPSLDRRKRLAASLVGAIGVLLLVLSRPSTTPYRKQTEDLRYMCRNTARELESFENTRTLSPSPWTAEEARLIWSGIKKMLGSAAEMCIPDVTSCDRPLITNTSRPQFTTELHELIVAFRTGEPCPR